MRDGAPEHERPLAGLRVLVAEDQAVMLTFLESVLEKLGAEVVAAARVARALPLAREAAVDCALLDINLVGEMVYPVAEVLASRGIPFVFASAYDAEAVDPAWSGRPLLRKPFGPDQLLDAISALVRPPSRP